MDYKYGPAALLSADAAERPAGMAATHERSAQRMLHVCQLHGGLYTKLGQFVASMTHILPEQYTTVLAACQDRANAVPFETARGAIETELGKPLEKLFASFEPTPIAAASLAQVHRAVTHDGERVAVKVQYPALALQMGADQRTLRALSWVVERAFPGCGYEWLLPEFEESMQQAGRVAARAASDVQQPHAPVQQELDFTSEATNATRATRLLAPLAGAVYVPRTLSELSSGRVLTMEFVEGVKLTDTEALAARGLDRAELATLLTSTFSLMIFGGGFVHCDPHSGNLLARPAPDAADAALHGRGLWFGRRRRRPRVQLVVLDHGLYRELGEDFRLQYSTLWYSLLTRDHARGRAAGEALGVAPADYDHLSLLLTFRPSTSRTAIGTRLSPEERASVRKRLGQVRPLAVGPPSRVGRWPHHKAERRPPRGVWCACSSASRMSPRFSSACRVTCSL
eukprot:2051481-Prymnesium_polylepis.1